VRTQPPRAPEAITFERDYPGTADQAQHVRADLAKVAASCPVADDLVLLASELATNAILHSRSGHPARTFAVRAALYPGDYAWVEVTDRGGRWTADEHDDEHGRGLAIVAAIAGDGNWGNRRATPRAVRHGSGSTGTKAPGGATCGPRHEPPDSFLSHEKVMVSSSRNRLNQTERALIVSQQ